MTKHLIIFTASMLLLPAATQHTFARGFGGMHHGGGHIGGGMHSAPHMAPHMSAPHMSAPRMNMGGGGMRSAPRIGGNFGGARPNMGNLGGGRSNFGGSRANVGRSGINRGAGQIGSGPLGGLNVGAGSLGPGPLAGPSNLKFPGGSSHGFGSARKSPSSPGARAGGSERKSPVRPGPDRPGPDRPGPDRPGPDRPGANRPGPDRPGASRPGPIRPGMDQRGHVRQAAGDLARRAEYARGTFHGHGLYGRDWYHRHPGCWYPRRWADGTIWAVWGWPYLDDWFGSDDEPIYYDYGNTVYYQDNSVYVNGENVGTADQYYQQASDLAAAGEDGSEDATSSEGDDGEWLPLGVFAMTNDSHPKADLILQLAVDKEGTIRGNYTATLVDHTLPITGSVDKKTQRAAWTIGDNKGNVFETGVYNLTKDEAPMLVHKGKDTTEQWTLVRLKDDDADSSGAASEDNANDPNGSRDQ